MKYNRLINKVESAYTYILFSIIIFVLTYNLFHYDPIQGYDGEAHHAYVQNFLNIFVPGKSNQPAYNFTYEFFSPPLPYLFPTLINEICKLITSTSQLETCQQIYGFVNIIFLSILYVVTLFLYMKIINLLLNKNYNVNLSILLTIGIFSANYKAIAMIRAEVYIFLLNALLIYRFLLLINKSFEYESKDILIFGIVIGLLALSRQWAFLLFPAYFLIYFFIEQAFKKRFLKFLTFSFFIGFLLSSWFYIGLFIDYGSFTAFNQSPTKFSFNNQNIEFYLPFNEAAKSVFSEPIRPNFDNQFLPILYSDLWGDYWGYFSFTSRILPLGRNQATIGEYLARVNLVSLIPTFMLLIGVKQSFKSFKKNDKSPIKKLNLYLVLSVFVSFFGYLWFLISFPSESGDTNKSIYIIQLFHLMGLCSALYLEEIKRVSKIRYFVIISLLFFVFIHNTSAFMSHFPKITIFY